MDTEPAAGRIVHLDTGLQCGGRLSYIDVPLAAIACVDLPALADYPATCDHEIRWARGK